MERGGGPENPCTWANAVTVLRAAAGVVLFGLAWHERSAAYNYAGLAVFWSLDVVDGYLARRLDQETRLGAQLDILTDRLLASMFYLNYLALHPEALLPVALFLIQFAVIDHYLSNQFMRWPILSPNYFYRVDRVVWLTNWSTPGKLLNGFVFTALLVATGSVWIPTAAALAVIALKLHSAVRLHRLPSPEAAWPRVRPAEVALAAPAGAWTRGSSAARS